MSKSYNNPMAITAMKEHFQNMTKSIEGQIDVDTAINPIKKAQISEMINKQDELKKLYQRQSIKPIEKHNL